MSSGSRDVRPSFPRDLAYEGGPGQVRGPAANPWDRVLTLGNRAANVGMVIGLLLAFGTHGVASARALTALYDMEKSVFGMREVIHEFLWTEYDIDMKEVKPEPEKKEEPPPPPPDPEPAIVQPAPKAADKPKDDPYEEQKAAPVQAAKILTAPAPDPNKVEDLTDQGIVSGDNTTGPLGGQSAAAGTSNVITHNAATSLTGKPGGAGTADAPPPPPGPPKPDLSRPAGIVGGASWSNCPFPDEADTDQIDYAQVTLIVTVRPDGSAQSVQVTSDPGHGFGRAARLCALARKYNAGLDGDGKSTTKSTPPIRVTFQR